MTMEWRAVWRQCISSIGPMMTTALDYAFYMFFPPLITPDGELPMIYDSENMPDRYKDA